VTWRIRVVNNVSQASILENTGGSVPHIQEHLVERAVVSIPRNQNSQLIRIPERRERPVNQANDFTEPNLGRRTAELIAPLCAMYAFDNASRSSIQAVLAQETSRHVPLRSYVPNFNGSLLVSPCERHHRLQCVQSFLRDFQSHLIIIIAIGYAFRPRSST
jgi:hypothetical protein